jgi:hypothetical protein
MFESVPQGSHKDIYPDDPEAVSPHPDVDIFDTPPEGTVLHDEHRDVVAGTVHTENLFNQPPLDGDVIDPVTGKRITNEILPGEQDVDDPEATLNTTELDLTEDVAEDPATKWLRENDPNFKG